MSSRTRGRRPYALLVSVLALSLVACEALPVVHVSVVHDGHSTTTFHEIDGPESRWPELGAPPVASALISVAEDEREARAASAAPEDSDTALEPVGRGGALGSFPVQMRTNENGHAQYRELRMQVLPFSSLGRVERWFVVSADGYRTVAVPIRFSTGSHALVVPLQRE